MHAFSILSLSKKIFVFLLINKCFRTSPNIYISEKECLPHFAIKSPANKNGRFIIFRKTTSNCIVCPERWGRKNDIVNYKKILESLHYEPNAVMTSFDCIKLWK